MNIYEKLSAITNELGVVAKNLQVQVSKTSSYKAVGELDVLLAVKPLEQKHRIYSYPAKRIITESKDVITQTQYGEKAQQFVRVETTYRFVDIDKPEDYIEVTSYGDGLDSGDKASGKAMTYADKYAVMKAYKIMTGDDPDQFASPESTKTNHEQSQIKEKDYRKTLIEYCMAAGLEMKDIAKEYKLNAKSTQQDFLNVLTQLGVEVKVN